MENVLSKNAVVDNEVEEVSKLDRINANKVNIIINEEEFVIPYGIKYKMVVKQPDDALSKMYDEKNEMIVHLRVPTNEYNDEDLQELINWSSLSNLDENYFRNLAVYMRMNEKLERTVVFTHAYIRMNKKVNTKADYVDIELIINQRGDKFVGVGFGHSLEDTLKKTKDRVENPQRINVIVPIVATDKMKIEGSIVPIIIPTDGNYRTKIGVYNYINQINDDFNSIIYPIPKKSVLEIRKIYEEKTEEYEYKKRRISSLDFSIGLNFRSKNEQYYKDVEEKKALVIETKEMETKLKAVFEKYNKDRALMEFYRVYMNSLDKFDPRLHNFSPNYIEPNFYDINNFDKPYYKMTTAYNNIMKALEVVGIAFCVLGIILPEPVTTAAGVKGATAGVAAQSKSLSNVLLKTAKVSTIAYNAITSIDFTISTISQEYDRAFAILISNLLLKGSIANHLWRGKAMNGYISYSNSMLWRLSFDHLFVGSTELVSKSFISGFLANTVNDTLKELNKNDIVKITETDIEEFFDFEMVCLAMPKPINPYDIHKKTIA